MAAYILRRLLLFPIVLWGVTLLLFGVFMLLTPQQRVATYVQSPAELHGGAAAVEQIVEKYGLDDPFPVQYWRWVSNVLRGNLGWSQSAAMPVAEALVRLFPATAELALLAIIPVILGGVWLGSLAAVHHNRALDHALRFFSMLARTFPSFVFGLLALMIFYGKLDWFPPGRLSPWANEIVSSSQFHQYTGMNVFDSILNAQWGVLVDSLRHLLLPVLILSAQSWAVLLRIMRSSMLETLRQEYVIVARAKGLRESTVISRHARRNALLPLVTVVGLWLAYLMGGVVIVETVFNYNGLGRFAATAAQRLDFPAVLGFTLLFATLLLTINLIVDLSYALLDPRIRLGS
jgi:ABC-type dipeptide/oligopeptide/nickel transport system permease component